MRSRFLLACLLLPALSFSQDLQKKIDLSVPASTADKIVEEFSKAAGLRMQVRPNLAREVLIVRAKGVSVKELMDRIAAAAGAEWQEEKGVQVLTRTPAKVAELARTRDQQLIQRINKAVRARLDAPEVRSVWTAEDARKLADETESALNPASGRLDTREDIYRKLPSRSPASRAIVKLIGLLDGPTLAKGLRDGKVVLSTEPNRMQQRMPNGAQAILNDYFREHTMFVEATRAWRETRPIPNTSHQVGGISRGEWAQGDPSLGMGESILIVGGNFRQRTLWLTLYVTDKRGKLLSTSFTGITVDAPERNEFSEAGAEETIRVSNLTKEFDKATQVAPIQSSSSRVAVSTPKGIKELAIPTALSARTTPLSPELIERLIKPDQYEPLGMGVGEAVLGTAEAKGLNLVANIQDDVFRLSLPQVARGVTPTAFLNSNSLQTDHRVAIDEGWLTIVPRDPLLATERRTNRAALAKLLQSVHANKILLLNQIAEFATSQIKPMAPNDMDFELFRTLNPSAADGTYSAFSWNMYRLYGHLSPAQRDGLARGGELRFSNMPQGARDAYSDLLFRDYSEPKMLSGDGSEINPYSEGIVYDWTELLPNGVPGNAYLKADVKQLEAAFCMDSRTGSAEILSADDFATKQFISETPGLGNRGSAATLYNAFASATLWTYNFTLSLQPGLSTEKTLKDGTIDRNASTGPISRLPSSFMKAMEAELAELREVFGKMDFTTSGKNAPPP